MSTVFTFSEKYRNHSVNYLTIVDISNIINLNVDYVAPSCFFKDSTWRYAYAYYALVIVPFIPFLISLFLYLLARFWASYIKTRLVFGTHFGFMCDTQLQATNYFYACLKQSVPFLGVVYNKCARPSARPPFLRRRESGCFFAASACKPSVRSHANCCETAPL